MYFKCKSCGSNEYQIADNQINCKYCGSSYFYEENPQETKQKNNFLIPLMIITISLLGFLFVKDTKVTQKRVLSNEQVASININNTNAQIGTQIVNINSDIKKDSQKTTGKIVHHTKIKNDKYTDKSIGYFLDENGNKREAIMLPKPKIHVDAKGNMIIDNKNRNLNEQKIEKYIDKNGLRTVVVTMSGFNTKENRVFLDKKGIVPLIATSELPSGIISNVKLSKDAKRLFYVSRYDFLYVVDISEIDKPQVLSKIELVNISDIVLSKDEKKLFLNSRDELAIFDISDINHPKKLGSIPSKNLYKGMVLSPKEDRLFIVNSKPHDTLIVIDIKDIKHPKIEQELHIGGTLWNIAVHKGKIYAQNSVIDPVSLKISKFDTPYSAKFDFFDNYIITQNPFNELALLQNSHNQIKKLNQLNTEAAWHKFYQRIRDIHFTKNGKYITMIVGKNSISFKRFNLLLPSFMVDEDSLYDKNDYYTKHYSAIVQPNIDEIKKLLLSEDGKKLFAFSRSDMFVYDVSKLR